MIVIHDDFDLPFGEIRLRTNSEGKSSHNGIRSIVEKLGTPDFIRLRVGLGQSSDLSKVDFVLGKFKEDQSELDEIIKKTLFRLLELIQKPVLAN